MSRSIRSHAVAATLVTGMFAVSAWAWSRVPDRIPVHFGLSGEPDRWGGRGEGLLLTPFLAIGLWGLFAILPRIDPSRRDYAAFSGAWGTLRLGILAFLAFVHVSLVANALGAGYDVATAITVGAGLLFAVIGNVLGKLRRNWFAGVRTPWTLSSDRSWQSTHRLTGWLFVVVGLTTVPAALASHAAGFAVLLGGTLVSTVVAVVWSWHVWRHDPHRHAAAGE